jgi:cytochrome c2
VGIGQLIEVTNFADEWEGDLLAASLVGTSLFRVRLDGETVRYVEPIKIGQRIRDIIQDPTGAIWLWTDDSTLIRLRPQSTATARSLLGQGTEMATARCAECHELSSGAGSRIPLAGVLGRPVASVKGQAYSQALRHIGGIWTEERLDAFLTEPAAMVPGTSMAVEGIADRKMRASIISALKGLK